MMVFVASHLLVVRMLANQVCSIFWLVNLELLLMTKREPLAIPSMNLLKLAEIRGALLIPREFANARIRTAELITTHRFEPLAR